jgi:hypothetical protein
MMLLTDYSQLREWLLTVRAGALPGPGQNQETPIYLAAKALIVIISQSND